MNKKIYFVTGIFAMLLVLSMFSLASAKFLWWDDDPQLGPGTTDTTPPIINAHECRADQTCEVNNLDVLGNINATSLVLGRHPIYNGRLLIYNRQSEEVRFLTYADGSQLMVSQGPNLPGGVIPSLGNYIKATFIKENGVDVVDRSERRARMTLWGGGSFQIINASNPSAPFASLAPTSEQGGISAQYLAATTNSSGNAYACLDSGGKLFRSLTPCR